VGNSVFSHSKKQIINVVFSFFFLNFSIKIPFQCTCAHALGSTAAMRSFAHFRRGCVFVYDNIIPKIPSIPGVECMMRLEVVSLYGSSLKPRFDISLTYTYLWVLIDFYSLSIRLYITFLSHLITLVYFSSLQCRP
jgi:hypothetical protein